LSAEQTPKLLISTNHTINGEGTSLFWKGSGDPCQKRRYLAANVIAKINFDMRKLSLNFRLPGFRTLLTTNNVNILLLTEKELEEFGYTVEK